MTHPAWAPRLLRALAARAIDERRCRARAEGRPSFRQVWLVFPCPGVVKADRSLSIPLCTSSAPRSLCARATSQGDSPRAQIAPGAVRPEHAPLGLSSRPTSSLLLAAFSRPDTSCQRARATERSHSSQDRQGAREVDTRWRLCGSSRSSAAQHGRLETWRLGARPALSSPQLALQPSSHSLDADERARVLAGLLRQRSSATRPAASLRPRLLRAVTLTVTHFCAELARGPSSSAHSHLSR